MRLPNNLLSLQDAKKYPDCYAIVDGEFGGICYLACPANLVECDERALKLLAHDLDVAVLSDDGAGAAVRYRQLALNEQLSGYAIGEEAGVALGRPWFPQWLLETGLDVKVRLILAGRAERLNLSSQEQDLVRVLHTEYQREKFEEENG